ncbi:MULTISPECIES: hypothetical protein [unclassified Bradyrhizobium]|nr:MULTISPECIES: hypothetical protein [unclassified Bradyrhizobium]WGR93122.1 hypothetical protein MTX20_35905 [Bradyrhizobium sp. ISRA435]WGR97631.1 hypothetical protein MTX23_24975 [Bradyrhizobium sp. ISRA436]WGS04521.1 hypothetical protein MTX18_24980 [Bradyrhizobium sp. ISRA437]WGS11402.1 hypothetical protein MTX26_24980 [Bradyrhizobium sp. ISRA443]WGS24120.1 hypothetical protein MTX22_30615 [Bradyrhizobium sp. ISRA463]
MDALLLMGEINRAEIVSDVEDADSLEDRIMGDLPGELGRSAKDGSTGLA